MKPKQKTIELNTMRIHPSGYVAISSLSLIEALHTVKEVCGEEATRDNIQTLIDIIHDLRPTV